MKSYVTSLKVSKKLVEAGWKKKTKFWWVYGDDDKWCIFDFKPSKLVFFNHIPKHYPAPLVSELLQGLDNDNLWNCFVFLRDKWDRDNLIDVIRSPDKLAECWIWAKENGLIKEKRCR